MKKSDMQFRHAIIAIPTCNYRNNENKTFTIRNSATKCLHQKNTFGNNFHRQKLPRFFRFLSFSKFWNPETFLKPFCMAGIYIINISMFDVIFQKINKIFIFILWTFCFVINNIFLLGHVRKTLQFLGDVILVFRVFRFVQ